MRRAALVVAVLIASATALALALAASPVRSDRATRAQSAAARWTPLAPSTIGRTEVAVARIGRHVYVVGGFEEPDGETSSIVERYDLLTNRWRVVAPLPEALNHAAAVAYRGDLYVLGGYRGNRSLDRETGALRRYRPATNRWATLPSMPTARGALTAGVIAGRLYAAGGATGGTPLRTLEVYDFARRRWLPGPSMPTAREHLGGTVAGDRLYALAGRAAGAGNFTVVERFDPRRRRWERLPAMRRERGGNSAATVGRKVVVLGGEEGAGTIKDVELYDPARRRWRSLPDMLTPRHGLGAVGFRGRVYAVQGGPTPGFSYSRAIEALRIGA